MKRLRHILYNVMVGIIGVNLLWWAAAHTLQLNVLVDPETVYSHLPRMLNQTLAEHLIASLRRIFLGVGIALLLGTVIGLWMSSSPRVNRVLGAMVYFTYPIPKLALLPVVMLLGGLGDATKVVMIVLIILFQIILAVRDAAMNSDPEPRRVLLSLGATHGQVLRYVTLPAILPDVLTTLRVAVGTAISVLFVTETYGTDRGMGYFIVDAWMRINYVEMYAGIVMLSMTGFLLFLLIDLTETTLCRWKKE